MFILIMENLNLDCLRRTAVFWKQVITQSDLKSRVFDPLNKFPLKKVEK